MIISPMGLHGANQRVANTMLALLWFGTTLAGFRAIRQRRFADHRQWMLRSSPWPFHRGVQSLDVDRLRSLCAGDLYRRRGRSSRRDQAIGVTSWVSWVVNLLIVEWWLHRRPGISA